MMRASQIPSVIGGTSESDRLAADDERLITIAELNWVSRLSALHLQRMAALAGRMVALPIMGQWQQWAGVTDVEVSQSQHAALHPMSTTSPE